MGILISEAIRAVLTMIKKIATMQRRLIFCCGLFIFLCHQVVGEQINALSHDNRPSALTLSDITIDIDRLPTVASLYQIELLVFMNNQTSVFDPDGIISEQWPKNYTLYYPENLDFVHPPLIDTLNRNQTSTLEQPMEFISIDKDQSTPLHDVNPPVSANKQPQIQSIPTYTDEQLTLSKLQLLTELPEHTFALKKAQQRIKNNTVHTVLYHKAWMQSLEESNVANAIAINGGQQFGSHFQLEGHVTISKDRYLHVKTDLWLNHFKYINHPIKSNRQQLTINSKNSFDQGNTISSHTLPNLPIDHERLALIADKKFNDQLDIEITEGINELYYSDTNDKVLTNLFEEIDISLTTEAEKEPLLKEDEAISYSLTEVFALRQDRKISSSKINYIDHPKMGLLIRVKKYSLPKIE